LPRVDDGVVVLGAVGGLSFAFAVLAVAGFGRSAVTEDGCWVTTTPEELGVDAWGATP